MVGNGSVELEEQLHLQNILYIPYIGFNFISVGKLTRDNNCTTHFSPSECYFQGTCMGKKIGNARNLDGLYILQAETPKSGDTIIRCYTNSSLRVDDTQILLLA